MDALYGDSERRCRGGEPQASDDARLEEGRQLVAGGLEVVQAQGDCDGTDGPDPHLFGGGRAKEAEEQVRHQEHQEPGLHLLLLILLAPRKYHQKAGLHLLPVQD